MELKPTIGLEIHVELKTRTKMFCGCLNNSEEKQPNKNVCPICLGHPGTLPTINKKALEAVIKLGLALNGKIAENSHFDRKSYFYPDLPKGYQISQYEKPLVEGGELNDIKIRRIHLEEDTGRLLHELPNRKSKEPATFVDFNRAGVPLMELVTEPDVKDADQAVVFAKELQLILRYLDISDADMEKGQMRVEVNISLNMGTKVEVKNINSFRAVHDAIEYELKRQEKALDEGEKIIQETRGWNDKKKITESQRTKESSHDYRYFPEPDLPPLDLTKFDIELLKVELPELPSKKRERFVEEFSVSRDLVEQLIEDKNIVEFFENSASELKSLNSSTNYQLLTNYLTSDLRGLMNEKNVGFADLRINPEHFAHFVSLVEKGELSSRLAKDVLQKMFETGLDPEAIISEHGLTKISDIAELEKIVKEIIKENPKAIEDYKKGKETSLQFLVGKAMAKLRGRGEPNKLKELFLKVLK